MTGNLLPGLYNNRINFITLHYWKFCATKPYSDTHQFVHKSGCPSVHRLMSLIPCCQRRLLRCSCVHYISDLCSWREYSAHQVASFQDKISQQIWSVYNMNNHFCKCANISTPGNQHIIWIQRWFLCSIICYTWNIHIKTMSYAWNCRELYDLWSKSWIAFPPSLKGQSTKYIIIHCCFSTLIIIVRSQCHNILNFFHLIDWVLSFKFAIQSEYCIDNSHTSHIGGP